MKKYLTVSCVLALSVSAVSAQSLYPGMFADKIKVETKAPSSVTPLPLSDVRLLEGRFKDNMDRDARWISKIDVDRLLHSFYNNAGVYAGREGGYMTVKKYGGWESLDCELRGHTTGHLLSATALMFAATGDDQFKLKGDSIVNGLKRVQDTFGNGYVSAFPEELINRNIKGQSVWAPWYTLHKILAGLIDQYLYADNSTALEIAVKFGDWIYNKLSPLDEETRKLMIRNEFGGINDALYSLYAVTGNDRYREMAEFFYHNDVIDPLKQKDGNMGTKHTNTFIPKTIAEIRRYELLGDEESLNLTRFFWDEMMANHTFPTGSLSDKEHYFAPQDFSKHITGYTGETCCTYNMLKLARHMYCLSPDSAIADYIETATYNHILGQQDPESGMVCYFLPLATGTHRVYSTPENSFWCCVGSGFENHAKYAENIYFKDDNSLYVNLFIASKADWREKSLSLIQTSTFPYDNALSMRVSAEKPVKASLKLRNPDWMKNGKVKINGKSVKADSKDGYFVLDRKWRDGDRIEVTFDTELATVTAPDNKSIGMVKYGPIVLAGRLGTEGMQAPAPFSDPSKYNDYYTYDFHIPSSLKAVSLSPSELKKTGNLTWETPSGIRVEPFFDVHRERYVVYWNIK